MKKNTRSRVKLAKGIKQIYENVAGIDIGAKEIYVAIPKENDTTEVHVFGTNTPELFRLAKELKEAKIQSAAMEATGIYWIPLFEILLERRELFIFKKNLSRKKVQNQRIAINMAFQIFESRRFDAVKNQFFKMFGYQCKPFFSIRLDRL